MLRMGQGAISEAECLLYGMCKVSDLSENLLPTENWRIKQLNDLGILGKQTGAQRTLISSPFSRSDGNEENRI